MKFLSALAFGLVSFLPLAFAQPSPRPEISLIKSIDDLPLPYSTSDASEEGLPQEALRKLLDSGDFTVLSEAQVQEIFSTLENDSQARNQNAGGNCAVRRSYIQRYLRKKRIKSGSLYIECPSNHGRLRLIDQVTGRRFSFTNFHDVNIVAVPNGHQVLDVQFNSEPQTLSGYLAQIEASQKIKPLADRSSGDRDYCYWSIKK